MKLSVQIEEIALNKPFVINDIYYETNKALIDPESKAILDRFAEHELMPKKRHGMTHAGADGGLAELAHHTLNDAISRFAGLDDAA